MSDGLPEVLPVKIRSNNKPPSTPIMDHIRNLLKKTKETKSYFQMMLTCMKIITLVPWRDCMGIQELVTSHQKSYLLIKIRQIREGYSSNWTGTQTKTSVNYFMVPQSIWSVFTLNARINLFGPNCPYLNIKVYYNTNLMSEKIVHTKNSK